MKKRVYTLTTRKVLASMLLVVCLAFGVHGQTELDLEKCIKIALANNLDIKRARNDALVASSNEKQSKYEFWPSVNAFANFNFINGLVIDPTTGTPQTETTQTSSPSIVADVTIFNGMRNHHNLSRNKLIRDAAQYQVNSSEDNTRIFVTAFYLEVLTSKENIKVSQERLNLLNEQLIRAEKRVEVGVENQEQVFNLKSQIARENLRMVNLKNDQDRSKLNLLQLLQLDPSQQYTYATIVVNDEELEEPLELYGSILEEAMVYSPSLKSADLNIRAGEKDLLIAKTDRLPVVSASASYGSFYSSSNDAEGYLGQLDLNDQKFVGFNLSVPIFNRYRIKNNIQVSKINMLNNELAQDQARLDLINNIQSAYQNLLAAQSTHNAAKENLVALDQSFRFSQTSYNSGNLDFYTYLESLNNKNTAEIELISSKYSFVLRKRILEIYKGNS